MLKRRVVVFLMLLVFPTAAMGQLKSQVKKSADIPKALRSEPSLKQNYLFGFLPFDPSRFRMSHSYGMWVFSLSGKTFSQGLYLNTMSYQIFDPLLLKVQLGLLYQPYRSKGILWTPSPGLFLSRVELDFRPSESIFMRLRYGTSPGLGYYRLRDPYWRR